MKNLVDNQTGKIIRIGDEVETFRGEKAMVVALLPYDGKTGHVRIRFINSITQDELADEYFYPSVIGAHFE
jgi:hypothetical protein